MSNPRERLRKIYESIENIEFIINESNIKVTQLIEDKIIKPAVRMNIIRIAEQFNKLKMTMSLKFSKPSRKRI